MLWRFDLTTFLNLAKFYPKANCAKSINIKFSKAFLGLALIIIFCFNSLQSFASITTTKSLPLTIDLKSFSQKGLYQDQKKFYPSAAIEPSYSYLDDEKKKKILNLKCGFVMMMLTKKELMAILEN